MYLKFKLNFSISAKSKTYHLIVYANGYLSQSLHERLIILHASSSINQNHVRPRVLCLTNSVMCYARRVLAIAFFEELNHGAATVALGRMQSIQVASMRAQLFYGTGPECVTGSDEHSEWVLDKPKGHFGQVGRFAHAVHATEYDDVRTLLALGLVHISQNVHALLGRQDLNHAVMHSLFDDGWHELEWAHLFAS